MRRAWLAVALCAAAACDASRSFRAEDLAGTYALARPYANASRLVVADTLRFTHDPEGWQRLDRTLVTREATAAGPDELMIRRSVMWFDGTDGVVYAGTPCIATAPSASSAALCTQVPELSMTSSGGALRVRTYGDPAWRQYARVE